MTEKIYQFQAEILEQVLPFVQFYENETIVVKYGGHVMNCTDLSKDFVNDIALLKKSNITPVIVHGGGPQIGAVLEKMGIKSKFENGLRITDQQTAEVVEMVLAGSINRYTHLKVDLSDKYLTINPPHESTFFLGARAYPYPGISTKAMAGRLFFRLEKSFGTKKFRC